MKRDKSKPTCQRHWLSVSLALWLAAACGSTSSFAQEPGRHSAPADVDEYIFKCDFESDSDLNFDLWPDKWRRQTGAGFPRYSKSEIQADPIAANNQVLGVTLDGGQAAVYSPPIKISQQCSYRLRFRVHVPTKVGHPCEAWASFTFFDSNEQKLDVYNLPVQSTTDGWIQIESPLISAERPEIASALVGLHVQPTEASALFGSAFFDDVSLQELPRLNLEFSNPLHVFVSPDQVRLTCRVSGMRRSNAQLKLELFDERENRLNTEILDLQDDMHVSKLAVSQDGKSQGYAIQQYEWRLVPANQVGTNQFHEGFYRLVITLLDRDVNPLVRDMTFVVMRDETPGTERLFGLSLPISVVDHDQYALGATLQQLGVNWIKLPVWLDHEDEKITTSLGNLLQRLARLEIDVVGVLDEPPPRVFKKFWQHEHGIAALTGDEDVFIQAIQPILVEWSLRIDRWQIGSDDDLGIAENAQAFARMEKIREHFRKYGEQTKVGLPWGWLQQRAPLDKQHWDFQSLGANPPLTSPETEYNFSKLKAEAPCESYIALQPLSSRDFDLATRVQEMCLQMIDTKRLGVLRAFVPSPFADDSGLFRVGNNPSEILLPWRTLAIHLNGAEYLGQIQLPNGSNNYWFSKNGEAFMFCWNANPTAETLYLGKNAEIIDLWGRREELKLVDGTQSFTADPWPRLVRGLNLPVALIRLSLNFDRKSLDSVSHERQPLKLTFQNHFPHGVSGNIFLSSQELFSNPIRIPFQAGKGEVISTNAPVQIRSGAMTKEHMMRVDFKMTSEELPSFSAWQPMKVGAENVEFAIRQRLEKNRFIIMITLINRSPAPVTYTLNLTVPDRKASNLTFYEVQPGQANKPIVLYNVESLIGKTLHLRATDEKRTMNYQIKVE
ncbi:MAG: hypothetical protein JNL67_06810 [Planctomycetaceae bacterium]|nr:hypothetical protein [Planctomycetaceae bacterium]